MSTPRHAEALLFQAGANLLEWLQVLLLMLLNLLLLTQSAGNRPEPLIPAMGLCAAMLVCHALWQVLEQEKRNLSLPPFLLWLLPLWLLLLVHWLVLSPAPWEAQQDLLMVSLGLIVFWVAAHHLRQPAKVYTFLIGIGVPVALGLAFGFMQGTAKVQALPWVFDLTSIGFIKTYANPAMAGVASGVFSSNLHLAALLSPAVLVLLVFALATRFNTPSRIVMAVMAVLCLCALVMTHSFGALLITAMLLFAVPFVARSKDIPVTAAAALMLALLVVALLGAWAISPQTRLWFAAGLPPEFDALWRGFCASGWQQFTAHWLAGSGSGSYPIIFEAYRPPLFPHTAHDSPSTLIKVIAETGLIGLFATFGIGLYLLTRLFRGWRQLPQNVPVESEGLERGRYRSCQPLQKVLLGAVMLALLAFGILLLLHHPIALPALTILAMSLLGLGVCQLPVSWRRLPATACNHTAAAAVAFACCGLLLYVFTPHLLSRSSILKTEVLLGHWQQLPPLQVQALERQIAYQLERTEKAVRLAPANAPAWIQLSQLRLLQTKANLAPHDPTTAQARADVCQALKLSPAYLPGWLVLAHIEQQSGDLPRAEAALQSAIEHAPHNPECWYRMATLLKQEASNRDRALEVANYARQLDPENPRTQQLQWQLMIP